MQARWTNLGVALLIGVVAAALLASVLPAFA